MGHGSTMGWQRRSTAVLFEYENVIFLLSLWFVVPCFAQAQTVTYYCSVDSWVITHFGYTSSVDTERFTLQIDKKIMKFGSSGPSEKIFKVNYYSSCNPDCRNFVASFAAVSSNPVFGIGKWEFASAVVHGGYLNFASNNFSKQKKFMQFVKNSRE